MTDCKGQGGDNERPSAEPGWDGHGCFCGAGPHPVIAGRCASGHVGKGNGIAQRTGLHASRLAEALAEERRQFLAASLTDDGGEDEVPKRRRSLHEYRARLHVHICQLSGAIEHHGMFDRRGRLRAGWIQRLEGLITTAHRLDSTLGLSRRARHVDPLEDYLDQREAKA